MTKRLFTRLTIACIAGCSLFPAAQAQTPNSLQQQAIMLRKLLEKTHYSPRPVNDELSEVVFRRFIRQLDPNGLYFMAGDLQTLAAYRLAIDDELNGQGWKFLPEITQLYKQRLQQAEKTFTEILQKPLSFPAGETITFSDKDSLNFAASEKDYRQRWLRWLKYQTLQQLVKVPDETQVTDLNQPGNLLTREPAARQQVLLMEQRTVKRTLEHPSGFDNYLGNLFFTVITNYYDPHTSYLSRTDWENYEAAMATETLSFGMDLDENESGDVVIARLVPGGPAWKTNELHKGDVLLEIQWSGNTAVDLSGADLSDVTDLLRLSNSGKLDLKVRKTSGLVQRVSLVKEKIREDENIVKSFVLKGERKIGYITLPGFYTEWDNETGQGCANDVAKEIVKLKKENIDGLILDIRHNGGGSLMEGLNLAGIFINEGPLLMLQGREGTPTVMKDMNRGTIYDGPLVLMVNGQSASASELLAAALQDYNRALIVGSPTYGLSTVTIHKLYRITGKTAQLKGVQPDVHLPDIYESLDYRENSYPFVLPADSLAKKVPYVPMSVLPVGELAEKSKLRQNAHSSFSTIQNLLTSEWMRPAKGPRTVTLQPEYFREQALKRYKWSEAFRKAMEGSTNLFTVQNTAYDQELMRMDTYGKEVNDVLLKNLQQDIYIEETYRIIGDMIAIRQIKK
jgi:carboxyl-terminal processing protease